MTPRVALWVAVAAALLAVGLLASPATPFLVAAVLFAVLAVAETLRNR